MTRFRLPISLYHPKSAIQGLPTRNRPTTSQTDLLKPHRTKRSTKRSDLSLRTLGPLFSLIFIVGLCMSTPSLGQDGDFSLQRISQLESERKYVEAIDLLTDEIERTPEEAQLYYWRGRSAFCVGNIELSKNDFNRYVKLAPNAKPRQWERGITLYYAKDYQEGADQFELYQSYHDNDVENSVWKYMCVAKAENVEAARKTMLPIRNDRRVPMMEIYRMFRGESSPEDVMEAADAEATSDAALKLQKFYANLYIGLYYEAEGDEEKATEYLLQAQSLKIDHYMWNVADVAADIRK